MVKEWKVNWMMCQEWEGRVNGKEAVHSSVIEEAVHSGVVDNGAV